MKVESYNIKGWEETVTGLLIAESSEWILVEHIPVDYMIDGFKLYRKKFIKSRVTGKKEMQIMRVFKLKKRAKKAAPKNFQFDDVAGILKWSEKKYGFFEFQDKEEDELLYGKINEIEDNLLIIDMIKASGEVEIAYEYAFELDEIRAITFDTNYFESVRLLMSDELKNKR